MKERVLLLLIAFSLSGCKVGPDYRQPEVILPNSYVEDLKDQTVEIEDIDLVNWWKTFNDPFLDNLLDIAINRNFDFKIALERVFQAKAQYWIQFVQILPEFDATAVGSRFRTSQSFGSRAIPAVPTPTAATTTISPFQNFYQTGLSAIWEIDLFGKFRRAADASYDLWQASEDDMKGVKIVVITEVADTYATICALQKTLNIANQVLELDNDLLLLAKSRFDAGLANTQEVETAIASLEADRSQFSLTEALLKQSIYSLSVLLGMLPEDLIGEFQIEREIPRSYGKIPVGLPSDLLRRRPDIRSAERQLAAATEEIGVAVADLFPTLSLTGSSSSFASNPLQGANVGVSSDTLNKLFKPASLIWGIGGFVTMPIFDFGKRQAAIDLQIALRNQSYFNYQKTVITALQETETALATYFNQEKSLHSLERQVKANDNLMMLTKDLYESGLLNYTELLQVKNIWLQSLTSLTNNEKALMTDLIAIYKALGGDW